MSCISAFAEAQPQKALDLNAAISGLSASLASSEAATRPIRVAFLALASPEVGAPKKKEFGQFFSERLAASLQGIPSKIRIFERQRLDAILAEHELNASGAVDAEGAIKIGELAPVDAIFTGSYTRVGSSVAVNARLVSVVSGEVLFARALTITIDDSIADFFGETQYESSAPALSDEDRLKAALSEMRALLADLSTAENVSAVVAKATSYKLFGNFAPVHELVVASLIRYKKASPAYRSFLVSSLASTATLGSGGDAYALADAIDFLANDGELDDQEFTACLSACRAMGDIGRMGVVFGHLLLPGGSKYRLRERIAALIEDIKSGRMGKPVGIDYPRGLLFMLGALQDDTTAFLEAYDPYISAVPQASLVSFAPALRRRFESETDPALKSKLIERIAANANSSGLEARNSAQDIYSFFTSLDRKQGEEGYARRFVELSGALLAETMAKVPYNKETRILLCLRYGIDCPSIVPSRDEIVRGLVLGEDMNARCASASMLEAMGQRAAFAEAAVDKVLAYIGDGSIDGMGSPNLQIQCLNVLANIGVREPKSLALIAAAMRHDYSDVREAASGAFLRLGAVSLPYVLEQVQGGEKERKLEAIKLLARMGTEARPIVPGLENALRAEKDNYVRDALSDALSRIGP